MANIEKIAQIDKKSLEKIRYRLNEVLALVVKETGLKIELVIVRTTPEAPPDSN